MRKTIAMIIIAMLTLALTGTVAEGSFFDRLEGVEWSFSSGAGGWSTDMRILPDGSFSGEYHDSEMGEIGDEYPNGTVYACSFIGHMSMIEQVNENTWKISVDALKADEGQEKETIDDGIRFVYDDPYGISAGDEMLLYQPGTPVSGFTEDMKLWAHLLGEDATPELKYWFLFSEKNESGFVGFPADTGKSPVNP